jgi:hypothetical protein
MILLLLLFFDPSRHHLSKLFGLVDRQSHELAIGGYDVR